MFYCGTRPGETMALQFCDIKNGYISINKTLTSHYGRKFDIPKTQSSIRMVKLDKKMYKDLIALKKVYVNYNDDYFIFGGKTPLSPTTIKRHKHKACENRHIREIKTHEFRHSYATRMIHKLPVEVLSKRLGHSSIAITLDIYVHQRV